MALPNSKNDREYKKFVEDASGDVAVRIVAEDALPTSGGGAGGGNNGYTAKPSGSNADGVSAYASATTLTVTGLPFTFTEYDIASITQVPTSGATTTFSSIADWEVSGTTITVADGTFAASDTFVVNLTGDDKGYTKDSTSNRMFDTSPDSQKYVPTSLEDDTNLTAATHDYEFTMDGYTDFSLSGKFIDADGTVTMKVYAMNDEDTASGDYIQVYGYDDNLDTKANSWTVTNGTLTYAISFNKANYTNWKVEIVCGGATNTVITKLRRKY